MTPHVFAATISSCPRTGHSDERLHWKIHRNNGQNHFCQKQVPTDFSNVFLAGDSAGANIAHHMAIRAEKEKLSPENFKISGMILFHPYFLSKALIEEMEVGAMRYYEKLWRIASPGSEYGVEDPWINVVGSDLTGLGCGRVLVMVAGNDVLARGGWSYAAELKKSGWVGKVEVMESKDEGHVFHLRNPDSDNARRLLRNFAEFLKEETC
ncbi:Alpha/beta hydrolase fold-3 [Arabidopsis thaliana x Arabidopsis arenosa]|uniref:Alpha/beta hydrolase fold-3 n=1 Tax=Arabidopsis thaliana x Arabidopsis arenosa TaxID=1240361 RepID=A0A8T2C2Q0_9BRAS|nr:Alpha/beta hydrolase fold-3 [Arabidopsis thaliana x Arabidopsis arenosa]